MRCLSRVTQFSKAWSCNGNTAAAPFTNLVKRPGEEEKEISSSGKGG